MQIVQEAQSIAEFVGSWRNWQKAAVIKAKMVAEGFTTGLQDAVVASESLKKQVSEVLKGASWSNCYAFIRFAFLDAHNVRLAKEVEMMYYKQQLKGQSKSQVLDDTSVAESSADKKKKKKTVKKLKAPAKLKAFPQAFFEMLATNLEQGKANHVLIEMRAKDLTLEVPVACVPTRHNARVVAEFNRICL